MIVELFFNLDVFRYIVFTDVLRVRVCHIGFNCSIVSIGYKFRNFLSFVISCKIPSVFCFYWYLRVLFVVHSFDMRL